MEGGVSPEAEAEAPESGVKDTLLGGREFRGSVEHRPPGAPELKPAPEGVPEKFWDPIKGEMRTDELIKSYTELEKRIGAPKDASEEAEGDDEGDQEGSDEGAEGADEGADEGGEDEGGEEGGEEVTEAVLAEAVGAAEAVYAEKGELSEEDRAPLKALGITDHQIDFYIQGVKATEAALHSAAHKAAGSKEDLDAAMAWAAKGGMTQKQIIAFNAQMGDVETVGPAVVGLMTAFRSANPGEGKLHTINSGLTKGDVYTDMDEFTQDLDRADKTHDKVARRKAIDKLSRSRKAGTIKSERRTPFG